MFELEGQAAIVTGGGGQLGRQFCRALLAAKASVTLVDRTPELVDGAVQELTAYSKGASSLLGVAADITRKADVERAVQQAVERFGRLDILVNNAALNPKVGAEGGPGALMSAPFEEFPLEFWDQALAVDLTGAFLFSQAVGRLMREQRSGVIINLSSIYGLVAPDQRMYDGATKAVSYSVTKAGIDGLTRYLAAYWGKDGIRVNTLSFGGIEQSQDAAFIERYSRKTPLGRMGRISDVSGPLLFLASPASAYMTGANLVVDGGWSIW